MNFAALVAALVLSVSPSPAADAAAPAASPAPIVTLDASSVMPAAPRSVEARVAGDVVHVSWQAPQHSGATALTGYVVFGSASEPVFVDAATTTATIPARDGQRIEVAALNEVASSLGVAARIGIDASERRIALAR